MRAGARKESVESRGGTSWNNGVYSLDGGGSGDGSKSTSQGTYFESGEPGRGDDGGIPQTPWFAPVDSVVTDDLISDCPGGVCPVPWAVKETTPVIQGDDVNHPPHYTDGAIECIEAIEAQLTTEEFRGYLKGNIAKYIWREKHKGGINSLKKALWYLDRLLQNDEIQKG